MSQAPLFVTTAAQRYAGLAKSSASGLQRKQRGQDKALRNESDEWKRQTFELFKTWLGHFAKGETFAMEDFRASAAASGHPEPHSSKVWGSMPGYYKARGVPIAKTNRTRKADTPQTHGHPVSLWRKTS